MDFLLLFYSLLMGIILVGPFVYLGIQQKKKTPDAPTNHLALERKMLLENLRDLRTDYETKKFSESDFALLSKDIVQKLEILDEKRKLESPKALSLLCECGEKDHLPKSQFCHLCGKKLIR
jgi:hypothetical protein